MIPLKYLERFYRLAKGKFFYVLRDSMDGMHDDNFWARLGSELTFVTNYQ